MQASITMMPCTTPGSVTSEMIWAASQRAETARPNGPLTSSPRARARLAVTTRWGSTGAHSRRNAASLASVNPSTDSAAMVPAADETMTGRPERNSANPRSTATWSGVPNGSANALLELSVTEGLPPLESRPAGPRSLSATKTGVFTVGVSKYHDTMTIAPKELPRRNSTRAADIDNEDTWADVPRMLRGSENSLPPPWEEIFGPLRQG